MTTPLEIDARLQEIADEIDKWDKMIAWHEAQRDHYKTRLTVAQARAEMDFPGPASRAKAFGVTQTEQERIDLDIAQAQLNLCLRRMHSLDKTLMVLMGRNKNAIQASNIGSRETW